VGEPRLARGVLERPEIHSRERDVLLRCRADAPPVVREPHELPRRLRMDSAAASCSFVSVAMNQLRGDLRRHRLAGELEVRLRRRVARVGRVATGSAADPQVGLPGHPEHHALQRGAEVRPAAGLEAAGAEQVDRRQQRAARAMSAYAAERSTWAAVARRSGLRAMASLTSAISCGSGEGDQPVVR